MLNLFIVKIKTTNKKEPFNRQKDKDYYKDFPVSTRE
jgi:hypothetical protein